MTEMEMLKELRNVVAAAIGPNTGGNQEQRKRQVRQELVDAVKEKFGLGTWSRNT